MSKKTPKRHSLNTSSGFSPVSLTRSPAALSTQKNLTGPPRVIRDIIADLYNNIQRWNSLHVDGYGVVKQIASLKADEPQTYSPRLEEYVNELYAIVLALKGNNDMFNLLEKQAEAFTNLPDISDPIFFSLSAVRILQLIREICEAYRKEYEARKFILENIAHSKNKNTVMFLAACWTHQLNVASSVTFNLEALLQESGHRPIQ